MKGCKFGKRFFSVSNEMIMFCGFFVCLFVCFQLVYMVDYIDSFSYVEPSLQLWDEDYFDIVHDFIFMCTWIQFVNILLSIFASMFMREMGL